MRLRVISGTNTYYWSVTNAAPAKPYLQISNQYLPLTTATRAGIKLKVQSGNATYRAAVYESGYYNTTSAAVGNLSSTTALTRASTSGTTYLTRASTSGTNYGTRASTSGTTYLTRASTSGYGTRVSTSGYGTRVSTSGYGTRVSTSGYATGASTVNYNTTGLLNIATHGRGITSAKNQTIYNYTVISFTNASFTVSRARSVNGTVSYIIDDGRLWILPLANNTSDVLRKCAGFTEAYSNMFGFNVYTQWYGTNVIYTDYVSCTNKYTYSSTISSISYANSGLYTLSSIYLSSTHTYSAPWYECHRYTHSFYQLGTTSSAASGYTITYGNNTTGVASDSRTSTIYTIQGVTSASGPAWSQSYTWQTSTIGVITATSNTYTNRKTFTYRWDWYTQANFVNFFTTGNVVSTSTKAVTTATLTRASTSATYTRASTSATYTRASTSATLTRASTSGTNYATRASTSGVTYLTRASTSGTNYGTKVSTSGYSGKLSSSRWG